MTTWRPVVGWEGHYEVSDQGTIRSCARSVPCVAPNGARVFRILRPRKLKLAINRRGHRRVMLHAPGKTKTHAYLHTLIALAFLGPRPPGLLVCHRDDRKSNNRAVNLYYGTRLDNAADYRRNRLK